MKTKKTTKTRSTAQKVKELIKLGLFFAVPVVVITFVLINAGSFNAF